MLKSLFLVANFFLIVLLGPYPCYAFDDGDFQYWNSESISWKINNDWKLNLTEEFRFGDDSGNFYYQHSDLGLTYSGLAEWLDTGFNYQQIFEEKESSWKYENRLCLNTAVKFNLGDCKLCNRSRFEYRNREAADNFWRYRNKLIIEFPLKSTRFEVQPYLADEIFVDFDKKQLNKNRLYAGFSMKLSKNLKGEIFYLRQSTKSSKWTDCNVLGTGLKLVF